VINYIFLSFNVLLLSIHVQNDKQKENENLIPILFKNSEYFSFKFLNSTYQYISAYFNSKYYTNKTINVREYNFSEKKVIRVKSTGLFNKVNHERWLKEKLNDKFILEYDSPNPDYLMYNVYNQEDVNERYRNSDAIRIALFTENEYPDMNAADYFIANFHIIFFICHSNYLSNWREMQ
jgi:hypothetical protein